MATYNAVEQQGQLPTNNTKDLDTPTPPNKVKGQLYPRPSK
jgi:hypothetical protein